MTNNQNILLCGDLHGDWSALWKNINKANKTYGENNYVLIQIGDLGIGFPTMEKHHGIWIPTNKENNDPKKFPENFYFVRGNHDSPQACEKYPNYLGNFGFNKDLNIFYISGAASHDKNLRTENVDWWPDEELTNDQFYECLDLYEKIKPEIVISHEPPVVAHAAMRKGLEVNSSKTSQFLQILWEKHQPLFHYYGHHHQVFSKIIGRTKFTCVAINQIVKHKG